VETKDIIDLVPDLAAGSGRAHGDSDNNFCRALLTQRGSRGPHRRSSGKSVIDQNHSSPTQIRRRPPGAISKFPAFQFLAFDCSDYLDNRLRIWQGVKDVFVQDADATGCDCAHGEFFVTRHAKLAHNENIERKAEPMRCFKRHRHPAARKSENDDVVASSVAQQFFRKLPTRVGSVAKKV
jgi:hypothetical protein